MIETALAVKWRGFLGEVEICRPSIDLGWLRSVGGLLRISKAFVGLLSRQRYNDTSAVLRADFSEHVAYLCRILLEEEQEPINSAHHSQRATAIEVYLGEGCDFLSDILLAGLQRMNDGTGDTDKGTASRKGGELDPRPVLYLHGLDQNLYIILIKSLDRVHDEDVSSYLEYSSVFRLNLVVIEALASKVKTEGSATDTSHIKILLEITGKSLQCVHALLQEYGRNKPIESAALDSVGSDTSDSDPQPRSLPRLLAVTRILTVVANALTASSASSPHLSHALGEKGLYDELSTIVGICEDIVSGDGPWISKRPSVTFMRALDDATYPVMTTCMRLLSLRDPVALRIPAVGARVGDGWLYHVSAVCNLMMHTRRKLFPANSVQLLESLMDCCLFGTESGTTLDPDRISACSYGIFGVTSVGGDEVLGLKMILIARTALGSWDKGDRSTGRNILALVRGSLSALSHNIASSLPLLKATVLLIRVSTSVLVSSAGFGTGEETRDFIEELILVLREGLKLVTTRLRSPTLSPSSQAATLIHSRGSKRRSSIRTSKRTADSRHDAEWYAAWQSVCFWTTSVLISALCPFAAEVEKQVSYRRTGYSMAVMRAVSAVTLLLEDLLKLSNHSISTFLPTIVQLFRQSSRSLILSYNCLEHKSDQTVASTFLRIWARAFTAAASSPDINKHAPFIICSLIDVLSDLTLSPDLKDTMLPGLFVLFDKCQSKQRRSIFAMLDVPGGALFQDLVNLYTREFKFVGRA